MHRLHRHGLDACLQMHLYRALPPTTLRRGRKRNMTTFQKSSGVLGGISYHSVNCWGDPVEDTPMHLWMISPLHLIYCWRLWPKRVLFVAGGARIFHYPLSYPTHRPLPHDAWSSNYAPSYDSYAYANSMCCPTPARRLPYQSQFAP